MYLRRLYILIFSLLMATASILAQNEKFVVVLDAGHGGHDAGAVGRPTTNREKDINLAITLKIGKLLEQNCPDVKVLYTRNTDVFVTLGGRADIANKAKADLFVSIHTNAIERNPARQPLGVQSYTLSLKTVGTNLEVEKRENSVIQFEADGEQKYSFANPNSSESDIMFELMQDRDMQESVNFAKLAQEEMVHSGGRKDMGVLQANLAVLRLTYMPSVLIEVGFISTPSEEAFLMSDEGRTVMAQSIYNAIARYKTQHTGRMSNLEKIDFKAVQQQVDQRLEQQQKQMTEGAQEQSAKQQPASATVNQGTTPTVKPATTTPTKPAETPNVVQYSTTGKQNTTSGESKVMPIPSPLIVGGPSRPIFKIQLFASSKEYAPGSPQFKGLKADHDFDGSLHKYTYGATTDYNEILRLKREIADKFPDVYIIALKDGVRIQLNDAIKEWRKFQK